MNKTINITRVTSLYNSSQTRDHYESDLNSNAYDDEGPLNRFVAQHLMSCFQLEGKALEWQEVHSTVSW